MKNYAKLHKKIIIDKNGHRKTVHVRTGEDPKSQGKARSHRLSEETQKENKEQGAARSKRTQAKKQAMVEKVNSSKMSEAQIEKITYKYYDLEEKITDTDNEIYDLNEAIKDATKELKFLRNPKNKKWIEAKGRDVEDEIYENENIISSFKKKLPKEEKRLYRETKKLEEFTSKYKSILQKELGIK